MAMGGDHPSPTRIKVISTPAPTQASRPTTA